MADSPIPFDPPPAAPLGAGGATVSPPDSPRIDSHRAIIKLWSSAAAFAADTDQLPGTVRQMARRNSIPPSLWSAVVTASERRGYAGVTLAILAALARPRRARAALSAPNETPSPAHLSHPTETANA